MSYGYKHKRKMRQIGAKRYIENKFKSMNKKECFEMLNYWHNLKPVDQLLIESLTALLLIVLYGVIYYLIFLYVIRT